MNEHGIHYGCNAAFMGIHCNYQVVNKHRRIMANYMSSSYSVIICLDSYLHKIVFSSHRFSLCSILILVKAYQYILLSISAYCFCLFHTYCGNFRMGKDCVRYSSIIHLYPPFQNSVVVKYFRFIVGNMLEKVSTICIPYSPYSWLASLKVFVHLYPSFRVCFNLCPFWMKYIVKRPPSGSYEYLICLY